MWRARNRAAILLLVAALLLLPVLAAPLDSASSPADTELVNKGRDYARDMFSPFFGIFTLLNVSIDSAAGAIQFISAFIMIFFVLFYLSGSKDGGQPPSPLSAFLGSVLAVGVLQFILRMDWYAFLVHASPAILAFMITKDLVNWIPVVRERTANWVGFFVMTIVFFTDYTLYAGSGGGIYSYFFGRFFGATYSVFMSPVTLIVVALLLTMYRIAFMVLGVMRTQTAQKYQRWFEGQQGHLQKKFMEQSADKINNAGK